MAHDIFVSYSNKDKAVADAIVASLEKNGIRCWYAPRDIRPSDDWGEAISIAIENSKLFIIIFSDSANKSRHVLDELILAIDEEIPIFPFRIENLEPKGAMRLHLSSWHWLDAYDPSWEEHINRLVETIGVSLKKPPKEQGGEKSPAVEPKARPTAKKRSLKPLWMVGLAVTLLVAGWFGFKALFPFQKDSVDPSMTATTSETSATKAVSTDSAAPEIAATEAALPIVRNASLSLAYPDEDLNLDPQIIGSVSADALDENLFLSLTKIDRMNYTVVPEAAENWTISLDGTLYTFNIRSDIPWVTHSLGGETVQVLDENGDPRFVTANDFVYAVYRICDPNFAGDYDLIFIPIIKGCREVNEYEDPLNIPEELFDNIGVRAVSEYELLIELAEPAIYFLSMITLNHMSALPSWAIEKYGEAWTNPGLIHTNGYFVIDQMAPGESMTLVRNSLLPEEISGSGNIGSVTINLTASVEDAYTLWKQGEVDLAAIPDASYVEQLETDADAIISQYDRFIFFFQLNTTKTPLDNVHLRRALAAALDKDSLVDTLFFGNGIGTNHLMLPDMIGSSTLSEVETLLYDPALAKTELAAAGYPNCEGLPQLNFFNKTSSIIFSDTILREWENALGCPENTFNSTQEFLGLENSDVLFSGWGVDFPDQYNLYENVINCENVIPLFFNRQCNEVDDLLTMANNEVSNTARNRIYEEVERDLFGPEGEYPLIPAFIRINNFAVHNWLDLEYLPGFSTPYYDWNIDTELKNSETAAD